MFANTNKRTGGRLPHRVHRLHFHRRLLLVQVYLGHRECGGTSVERYVDLGTASATLFQICQSKL